MIDFTYQQKLIIENYIKGNIISKNVTCEACYEVPAIITALLPMGSEIPMCKKCAIESMNYALEGRGGLYVAQDTDD